MNFKNVLVFHLGESFNRSGKCRAKPIRLDRAEGVIHQRSKGSHTQTNTHTHTPTHTHTNIDFTHTHTDQTNSNQLLNRAPL